MKKGVFFNYVIILGIFLAGIIGGIIFINHTSDNEVLKITNYIENIISSIKTGENIDKNLCFVESLRQNLKFVIIIWIFGSTIIGSFFICFIVCYRGFSVGYTISAIIASLGIKGGSVFVFSSLFLQNIIMLPAIFVLAESGFKVYYRIIKNGVDIKSELIRHFIVMLIVIFITVLASVIEAYLSTNLLLFLKNFI